MSDREKSEREIQLAEFADRQGWQLLVDAAKLQERLDRLPGQAETFKAMANQLMAAAERSAGVLT